MKRQVQNAPMKPITYSLIRLENKKNYFTLFVFNIVFFILMSIFSALLILVGQPETNEINRLIFFIFSIFFTLDFLVSIILRLILTYKFRWNLLGSWNFVVNIIAICWAIGSIVLFTINYEEIIAISTTDPVGIAYLSIYIIYTTIIFATIVFMIWYDSVYLTRGQFIPKYILLKHKRKIEKRNALKQKRLELKENKSTYELEKFRNKFKKQKPETKLERKVLSWYYMNVLVNKMANLILKWKEISNRQIISKLAGLEKEKSKYLRLLYVFDKEQQDAAASMAKEAVNNSKFQTELAKKIKAREEEMKRIAAENEKAIAKIAEQKSRMRDKALTAKNKKKNKKSKKIRFSFINDWKNDIQKLFAKKPSKKTKVKGKEAKIEKSVKEPVKKVTGKVVKEKTKQSFNLDKEKIAYALSYSFFRVRKALGLVSSIAIFDKKNPIQNDMVIEKPAKKVSSAKKVTRKKTNKK